jgi:hypothetical protein
MRRSSCVTLVAASCLVTALGVLMLSSKTSGPERMDLHAAETFLKSGQQMLAAGDTNGIMDLFSPDARVLGAQTEDIRTALMTAVQEMNGRPLKAVIRNLSAKPGTDSAFLTFDIDLDEQQKGATIHYFTSHVNLTLKKMQTSHWYGLYRTTDWKITQLDAEPPFGFINT